MSDIKFETLKQNVEIDVKLPSELYYRINQLILFGFPFKDKEDFAKTLEIIKNNSEDTPESYHMKTLMALQMKIEEAAREQGHIEVLSKEELDEKFKFEPLSDDQAS